MIRRPVAVRAIALAMFAIAIESCGVFPSETNRRRPVAITFSRAEAISAFPGAYVSVLDTAVLTIVSKIGADNPNGTTQTLRARVGTRDSVVAFEADLDTGTVSFSATVQSNNGARLYSGNLNTKLTTNTDSVNIQLAATAPVMLLSLDFPRTDVVPPGASATNRRTFTATIYNRGIDAVTWAIGSQDLQTCACTFSVAGGKIAAGLSGTFQINVTTATVANAPANPPRFTVTSAQGNVSTP